MTEELNKLDNELIDLINEFSIESSETWKAQILELINTKNYPETQNADIFYTIGLELTEKNQVALAKEFFGKTEDIFQNSKDYASLALLLHNLGTLHAGWNELEKAKELWEKSITLKEVLKDEIGLAASFMNIAWLKDKEGLNQEAYDLNLKAAYILSANESWIELFEVLNKLAKLNEDKKTSFLGQALYLSIYNPIPAESIFFLVSDLLQVVGLEHESAPILASLLVILIGLKNTEEPNEELNQAGLEILGSCAVIRNIDKNNLSEWINEEGLNNLDILFGKLESVLEALIDKDSWIVPKNIFTK